MSKSTVFTRRRDLTDVLCCLWFTVPCADQLFVGKQRFNIEIVRRMHGRGEQIHSHTPLSLRHRVREACRARALTWCCLCMGGVRACHILLSLWSLIANVEQFPDRRGHKWVKNPVQTFVLACAIYGPYDVRSHLYFTFHCLMFLRRASCSMFTTPGPSKPSQSRTRTSEPRTQNVTRLNLWTTPNAPLPEPPLAFDHFFGDSHLGGDD